MPKDKTGTSPGQDAAAVPASKPRRTKGLWLFDIWLYPIFTYGVVFAISVAATYLTSAGRMIQRGGKFVYDGTHGVWGKFFFLRGEWLKDKLFRPFGMGESNAEMAKMVLFSFVDGSLVAPFVKLFEDKREKIGRWIDRKLGTRPRDEDAAYAAEPKQGWLSVLGGRIATFSIVFPVAVLLSRKIKGASLNDRLFHHPGLKAGEWAAGKPGLARWFGRLNVPQLFKTGFFEGFYTFVCTAGLYFSSRFFARAIGKKGEDQDKAKSHVAVAQNDDVSPVTGEIAGEDAPPRRSTPSYRIPPRTRTHIGAVRKRRRNDAAEKIDLG